MLRDLASPDIYVYVYVYVSMSSYVYVYVSMSSWTPGAPSVFCLLRWSLPCRWVLRVSWQGAVTWHSQHWNVSFSSQERWDCGDLLLVLEEVHLDDDLKLDG